jgi:hypothetical protein
LKPILTVSASAALPIKANAPASAMLNVRFIVYVSLLLN